MIFRRAPVETTGRESRDIHDKDLSRADRTFPALSGELPEAP
jgi:hypothetical protein